MLEVIVMLQFGQFRGRQPSAAGKQARGLSIKWAVTSLGDALHTEGAARAGRDTFADLTNQGRTISMAARLPPGKALALLVAGTGLGWGIMKLTTPTEYERRKEAAEWDKLYGKTTVEEQYRKAVEREEPKKV
ncbi:hypothetical protein KEM48_000453 [Puccinia striiformis f. sp. tritici PST-130]|nr:hypothetical protein KEM48_000453 [Puccinia striiformis f. sp. tritici PST-130]